MHPSVANRDLTRAEWRAFLPERGTHHPAIALPRTWRTHGVAVEPPWRALVLLGIRGIARSDSGSRKEHSMKVYTTKNRIFTVVAVNGHSAILR